jgi:hypothetical protein
MKRVIIILIVTYMLMGCSINGNDIKLEEARNEILDLKDEMKNTTILVEKLQNKVNISEEEKSTKRIDYTICETQPLESKTMILEKSDLYSAPSIGAEIIEEYIEGRLLVLYEVNTENGKWAYVILKSKDKSGISPYGFVTSDLLSYEPPNAVIVPFAVTEDISIGMTFSEMKLLFGNNYIALKDFYDDSVVFYFDEERYKLKRLYILPVCLFLC